MPANVEVAKADIAVPTQAAKEAAGASVVYQALNQRGITAHDANGGDVRTRRPRQWGDDVPVHSAVSSRCVANRTRVQPVCHAHTSGYRTHDCMVSERPCQEVRSWPIELTRQPIATVSMRGRR